MLDNDVINPTKSTYKLKTGIAPADGKLLVTCEHKHTNV